jgi:positive regulator of sigma E activity
MFWIVYWAILGIMNVVTLLFSVQQHESLRTFLAVLMLILCYTELMKHARNYYRKN